MPSMLEKLDIIFMLVTPTTWPYMFSSAPPELPSLMAVLVWMRFMLCPS